MSTLFQMQSAAGTFHGWWPLYKSRPTMRLGTKRVHIFTGRLVVDGGSFSETFAFCSMLRTALLNIFAEGFRQAIPHFLKSPWQTFTNGTPHFHSFSLQVCKAGCVLGNACDKKACTQMCCELPCLQSVGIRLSIYCSVL